MGIMTFVKEIFMIHHTHINKQTNKNDNNLTLDDQVVQWNLT